jgi:GNAT superfamily N-acetyltransferase
MRMGCQARLDDTLETTRGGDGMRLSDQASPDAAMLLRELHEKVLAPSFSAEEYIPPTTFEPSGELSLIACDDDGSVLGGAIGELYSTAVLLAYLAVRPGFRGSGIGSALLAAVKQRWLGQRPVTFVELDDPRHHKPDPGYGDPADRLRFYGSFGTRLLAMPYFQPRLRDNLPRGYHLFLGVVPPEGVAPPTTMPASTVTEFLKEYFEVCEGSATLNDPEFRWLLQAAEGQEEISLVTVGEYSGLTDVGPPSAIPADTR